MSDEEVSVGRKMGSEGRERRRKDRWKGDREGKRKGGRRDVEREKR